MLNWTDFSVLLMILAGPFSGVAAAHQHKAGVASLILFGVVGLAVGFGVGMISNKFAYRILRSKRLPEGLKFVAYMFTPMCSLLLVILLPAMLAVMIWH
jgi:uncharacterized membrane-anchored protein